MTLAPERPAASATALAGRSTGPGPVPALVQPLDRAPAGRRWQHFDGAARETSAGRRLAAVRALAQDWRADFTASGRPDTVLTCDLVTLPYPTRYGLFRAAASPAPYLAITNRMVVVRWADDDGTRRTLLFEPSDIDLGERTPFFQDLVASAGPAAGLLDRRLTTRHGRVLEHLRRLGIAPEEVDYLVFDHLHTQDVRRWLGTTAPQPDLAGLTGWPDAPLEPVFPNARLLVQREELEAMVDLHPFQRPWYQAGTFADVRPDAVVALDGDVALGPGVGVLSTPGHTVGNQSLVVHTSTGVWASSENAVSAECLVPEHSRIPGVARYARRWGQEVVLNSNTPEMLREQYDSMVKEKSVVDPSLRDPRFPQFFPSSELTAVRWSPGTRPTFTHGALGG